MVKSKNLAVNEAPVESLLDQNLKVAHAKHRNGALPADPDEILPLQLQVYKGVAEEPAYTSPLESPPPSDRGDGFSHAGPNELLGFQVQDDVVERLRVAIKSRRH